MKRRQILTYLCFVGLLAIWLIGFLALNVDAMPPRPEHTKATMPEITLDELEAAENEPCYPGRQAGHCGTRSPGGVIFRRENG